MILETIRQLYPQLTKSQRRLADYIANSYQEAAFMTASRLASRLEVNEATVIRFAQRLGYPGYPEMIRAVQAVVQEELRAGEEAKAATPAGAALLAGLSNELECLQRAASHVSSEMAQRLVTFLLEARRIYVTGQGVSYHLAGAFAAGLAGTGRDGRLVAGEAQALAQALAELESSDTWVGVAVSEESPEAARAMVAARARGARTLAVTWSPISRMAQVAELALTCPTSEPLLAPPCGVAAALLNALVQALASCEQVAAREHRRALDEALSRLRGDDTNE